MHLASLMVKSNAVPKFLLATDTSLALTAPKPFTPAVWIEVRQIHVDFAEVSKRGWVSKHFRFTLNFDYSLGVFMIFSVGRSKIYFSMDITSNHLFDGLSVNSSFESVGLRDWDRQHTANLESEQNLVRASIFFLCILWEQVLLSLLPIFSFRGSG